MKRLLVIFEFVSENVCGLEINLVLYACSTINLKIEKGRKQMILKPHHMKTCLSMVF